MRPTRHVPSRDRETPGGGGLSNLVAQGLRSPPASATAFGLRRGRLDGVRGRRQLAVRDRSPARGSASSNAPATTRRGADGPRSWKVVRDTALTPPRTRLRALLSIFRGELGASRRREASERWRRPAPTARRSRHQRHDKLAESRTVAASPACRTRSGLRSERAPSPRQQVQSCGRRFRPLPWLTDKLGPVQPVSRCAGPLTTA